MTDIVERLRELAPVTNTETRTAMTEAAAEIERLRKDLSLAVFADKEYWQVLEKENERLRAALESIKDMTDYGTETATWRMTSAIHNVNVIARAALEAAWQKWLDMDADPGAALILPLTDTQEDGDA